MNRILMPLIRHLPLCERSPLVGELDAGAVGHHDPRFDQLFEVVDAGGVQRKNMMGLHGGHDAGACRVQLGLADPWQPLGSKAASAGVRILGGEAPGDINTRPIKAGTPRYDWRELQRWNISESRLPADSEIYFRSPGIWEQYQSQVTAGLAALLIQALIISTGTLP